MEYGNQHSVHFRDNLLVHLSENMYVGPIILYALNI